MIREITDAKGKPAWTVLLYRDDSGSVFCAGTSQEIADVVQGSLQCDDVAERVQFSIQCKDDKLADGLETALREPLQVSSTPKEPTKKRRITKKT